MTAKELTAQPLQLPQTAEDMKEHIQVIQRVMKGTMINDTHYGTIPGTHRPTLYKAGAELLLTTFRVAVHPEIHDLSTPDEIRYRILAKGQHIGSGNVIGVGIGECSTNEEKYRWRDAVCQEEWDGTSEGRRREKYARGKSYTRKQVRTVPADLANTVLKMAKKRAEVDLCLTALACSDVFAQDLEDSPPPPRDQGDPDPKAQTKAPTKKAPIVPVPNQTAGQLASAHQLGTVMALANRAGVADRDIFKRLEIGSWEELKFDDLNPTLDWLRSIHA